MAAWLVCNLAPAQAASRTVLREEIQLAVWHGRNQEHLQAIRQITRATQATRRGLAITIRAFPPEAAYRQIQQWCEPKAMHVPDVVVVPDIWLPTFSAYLQPLNALLPARDVRRYPESVRQRLRHADSLYGIPWRVKAQALFYLPKVLSEVGVLPPRTWDELLTAARRCHKPPQVYGFGLPGVRDEGASRLLLQLLRARGGALPPVHDPSVLSVEPFTKALQLYTDLHKAAEPEVLSWDQPSLEEFFLEGRLAMLVSDCSFEQYIRRQDADPGYATCPVPSRTAPGGQVSVEMACIFAGTDHREAAVALLRALTKPSAAERLLQLGGVPAHNQLLSKYRLEPRYAPYVQGIDRAEGLPVQRWGSAQPILADALFYVLTGRRTVQEAASWACEAFAGAVELEPAT